MAGFMTSILIFIVALNAAYGMDCTLGTSENTIDKIINTCPRPIIGNENEKYCCWSNNGKSVTCCNLSDFILNSISILLPLIIIGLVVSFIVSCILCLCCPCCCFYKGRSGGSCV